MEGRWLVAGDFNKIADPSEQKGGALVNVPRCNKFRGHIDEWGLIDVETKGPMFMWEGPK